MLNNQADLDSLNALLDIFMIEKKRDLGRYCNSITVTGGAFGQLLLAARAGALGPLLYACHFGEHVPDDVELTEKDELALAGSAVGPSAG